MRRWPIYIANSTILVYIWILYLYFSEKQAQLDFIGSKLKAQMVHKVSNEDERIKTAVMEKEALKTAEEAEKAEKRRKTMQSIEEHRVKQVQNKTEYI